MNQTPLHSFFHIGSNVLEGSYGLALQLVSLILFLVFFNVVIKFVLSKLQNRLLKQHKVWALSLVTALDQPLNYFAWFVALVYGSNALSKQLLSFPLLNIDTLLSLGAVLATGWFFLKWNSQVVHYMMEMSHSHRIALTPGKLDLLSKMATVIIIFMTLFFALDATGRDMQTLIAFGGIGGLALAFASQQVISNFFGGIMVYTTQPFTIGEFVSLPEKKIEGHVEEIGWYMTLIRNQEKRPIYVPNSIFTQTIVITPSRMSHERFFHTIGLRYTDIGFVKQVVNAIKLMLLKHPHVDHEQKVEAYFFCFGPSSLDINISAYIKLEGIDFPSIRQDILLRIADIIAQQGAIIATPTNIVEIQGGVILKSHEGSQARASSLTQTTDYRVSNERTQVLEK